MALLPQPILGCQAESYRQTRVWTLRKILDQRLDHLHGIARHRHWQIGDQRRARHRIDRQPIAAVDIRQVERDLNPRRGDAMIVVRLVGQPSLLSA